VAERVHVRRARETLGSLSVEEMRYLTFAPNPMAVSGSPEQLLLQQLPYIERVGRNGARRHGLRPEDAEDFVSELKLKLIAGDYAVIRKYKGESTFTTYLHSVVSHYLLDYRDRLWGKWRPSAEAKRLGDLAVLLERLLVRDGHSLDEACEMVRVNYRWEATRAELDDLAARLPVRVRTRGASVAPEDAPEVPDPAARADERLIEADQDRERQRVADAVRQAVAGLPDEDRLIVRMRVDDGFTVGEIARTLHLEAKPLYRRLDRIFKSLREELQRHGIDAAAARHLEAGEPPAEAGWSLRWERSRPGPSKTFGRV
jgi:RNA polymerase sigma factor (sigma-70 family)